MGSIESNETVVGDIDGAPHLFASPKRAMLKIGANLAFSTALNLVPIVPTTGGGAESRNRRPCAQLNIFVAVN